jgi:hypothetical protein
MNQTIVIIIVIIICLALFCTSDKQENFYYRSPPLSYNAEACQRLCDNTDGCNSSYFDPSTRACWMNSYYKYGDIYYPYVNNTYFWTPSRFRFGKYFGKLRNARPLKS